MNKIAIICPYFGKFPSYINLTFKSMERKKFIDWYIFTDNIINQKKDENIKIIHYTFDDFKVLVNKKIGTSVINAYKICDYKPTFGHLFENYIKKYEFWGYCDLDVIFGNLRNFLTAERLKKFDKIYDLGHLTIIRNSEETRLAYKNNVNSKKIDYKKLLNSEFIFVLDETYDQNHQGINGVLKANGYKIFDDRKEYADISIKYNNFYPCHMEKYKYYYILNMENGLFLKKYKEKLYCKEIAYIHLQQKKNLPVFCVNMDEYMILPKGFFDVQKLDDKFFYTQSFKYFKYIKYRLEKKLKNIKRNLEIGFKW